MPKARKEFLDLLKYIKELKHRNRTGQWTKAELNNFRRTIENCIRVAQNDGEKRMIAPAIFCWNRNYPDWQKYFPDLPPLRVTYDPPSNHDIPDKLSVALRNQGSPIILSRSDLMFLEQIKIPPFTPQGEQTTYTEKDLRFLKIAEISPK